MTEVRGTRYVQHSGVRYAQGQRLQKDGVVSTKRSPSVVNKIHVVRHAVVRRRFVTVMPGIQQAFESIAFSSIHERNAPPVWCGERTCSRSIASGVSLSKMGEVMTVRNISKGRP